MYGTNELDHQHLHGQVQELISNLGSIPGTGMSSGQYLLFDFSENQPEGTHFYSTLIHPHTSPLRMVQPNAANKTVEWNFEEWLESTNALQMEAGSLTIVHDPNLKAFSDASCHEHLNKSTDYMGSREAFGMWKLLEQTGTIIRIDHGALKTIYDAFDIQTVQESDIQIAAIDCSYCSNGRTDTVFNHSKLEAMLVTNKENYLIEGIKSAVACTYKSSTI